MYKRELLFAAVTGVLALLGLLAMSFLVAKPKLLFGRSLSAIEPTLFPYLTLALIVVLSACLVSVVLYRLHRSRLRGALTDDASDNNQDWYKISGFFVLLVGYGLLLKPLGFLLSSCAVISAMSLMLGNRNWLQVAVLAVVSPICLYLLATRGMLVSLPELNQIELLYAQLIAWVSAGETP